VDSQWPTFPEPCSWLGQRWEQNLVQRGPCSHLLLLGESPLAQQSVHSGRAPWQTFCSPWSAPLHTPPHMAGSLSEEESPYLPPGGGVCKQPQSRRKFLAAPLVTQESCGSLQLYPFSANVGLKAVILFSPSNVVLCIWHYFITFLNFLALICAYWCHPAFHCIIVHLLSF
jgi:hypothetical protein